MRLHSLRLWGITEALVSKVGSLCRAVNKLTGSPRAAPY
jgi:hypothetical protein